MSVRNWLIASATGLACLALIGWGGFQTGFVLGEQSGEYQANIDTYARHAQQTIERACAGLNFAAQTECIMRVVETSNEHERAEGDLMAQRNMARWALLMLIATAFMALATALGVYYVWRTLKATQDSVAVMREEQRPWIWVDDFQINDIRIVEIDGNPTVWVEWKYILRNTGATAAINLHSIGGMFVEFESAREYTIELETAQAKRGQGGGWAIAPGAEFPLVQGQSAKISPPDEGVHNTVDLLVAVVVTYSWKSSPDPLQTTQTFWITERPSGSFSRTALDFEKIKNGTADPCVEPIFRNRMI